MSVVLCLAWACTAPEKGEVISTWPSSGHPKEVHTVLGEGAGTEVQILHENGSIHMRGTLLEGKRNGVWNTYREDGLPWSQVHYDSGSPRKGSSAPGMSEGCPTSRASTSGVSPLVTWRFYGTDGAAWWTHRGLTIRRIEPPFVGRFCPPAYHAPPCIGVVLLHGSLLLSSAAHRTSLRFFWDLLVPVCAGGEEDQRNYILKWKDEAVRQMALHRIPASITLAQGLLESGSGKSALSSQSNNHFGIKCHKDWEGGRTYHDDDAKGECFRVYPDARESFEDHSLFLKRKRYAPLFRTQD